MHVAPDDFPMPEIPTIDSVARAFPVLLATLAPQPSVREVGVGERSSTRDGVLDRQSALITYAVLRNPADLDDPVNHVPLAPEVAEAIRSPSPRLPPAIVETLPWMRFPQLWEAVQTHVPRESWQSLPERLAEHMVNVLMNAFRDERVPDPGTPWEVTDAPLADRAEPATVVVDGVETTGIRIPDEHVLGVAVDLGDAVATVVLAKHLLPHLDVALARRPRPSVESA